MDCVLRPVAVTLAQLATAGVTHRAIRPDNLFNAGAHQPAVLGSAWAAPPASLQPAVFEPPYSAMCVPAGRGDGSIGDDIYALGVTLIALALGKLPMAGLADIEIVRRKLELGCFSAVLGDHRLPAVIGDLVRGMLAEDPAHRPPPQVLLDISVARSRRLAVRQPRRAPRPLQVDNIAAGDARGLAHAMAVHPADGLRMLRDGTADNWVRRVLRDVPLANRIDEAQRLRAASGNDSRTSAMLMMQVVALLDPTAPLCWQGLALWPDGLGTALVAEHRKPENAVKLDELVQQNAVSVWATARTGHCDVPAMRRDAEQWRSWSKAGGAARLCYELNPLLPCASPLLAGSWVARLLDLAPALELASANPDFRKLVPVDADIAAFIAAHREERLIDESLIVPGLTGKASTGDETADRATHPLRAQLRLLAKLQMRLSPPRPLPGLAAWLVEHAGPLLASWNNRAKRTQIQQLLATTAKTGQLPAIVALLDDESALSADRQGLRAAAEAISLINAELHQIEAGAADRRAIARRIGRDVAAGTGLTSLAAVLAGLALG